MRRKALGLPILVGLSVCAPAFAQQDASQVPPIKPSREIQLHAGATLEYRSNIGQTNKASAAARGISSEDWIARPTLDIDAFQPLGRNGVYLKGLIGYQFHDKNKQLDSAVADLSGGAVSNFGFCQAATFGGYSRSRSELGDLAGPSVRNILTSRRVGANIACGRESGFGGVATVSRDWRRNSAILTRESNVTVDSVSLIASYGNPGLGKIYAIGSYVDSDYANRRTGLLPTDPIGETVLIRTLGMGYEKMVGARLKFKGDVTRTFLKRGAAPAGVNPKFSSNTYSGAINYRASPRLSFDLTAARAITPSNVVGKVYDQSTDSELTARYKLGSSFNVSAGVRREDTTSNTDSAVPLLIYSKARTDSAFGGVTYARSRLGSLGLEVRQTNRDTDRAAFDYSDTRVALTLDARF